MVSLFSVHDVAFGTKVVDKTGLTEAILTALEDVLVAVVEDIIESGTNE